jgi:hypothetical protein
MGKFKLKGKNKGKRSKNKGRKEWVRGKYLRPARRDKNIIVEGGEGCAFRIEI